MVSLTRCVLDRLQAYARLFADDFRRHDQARWTEVYLQGLLAGYGRKNVENLARQIDYPRDLKVDDLTQALQNFVNQSPWDEKKLWHRYRAHLVPQFADPGGIFVVEDVAIAKQGDQSVGVQRQYCGSLGKKINCQLAVVLGYVSPRGVLPLMLRLYLPRNWQRDPGRLDTAGVPDEFRHGASKDRVALELLDQARAEGFPGRALVAGPRYGGSAEFRAALVERSLEYLLGVGDDFRVFANVPTWATSTIGSDQSLQIVTRLDGTQQPLSVSGLAQRLARHPGSWREGAAVGLEGQYTWLPVCPGLETTTGADRYGGPTGLLIHQPAPGKQAFALGSVSAEAQCLEAQLWKCRSLMDRTSQQLRTLGLDHFEGRSWRGFHHHACLVMLAHGFLTTEEMQLCRCS